MGENSKIEWTHHTFNPCGLGRRLRVAPEAGRVRKGVTAFAQGNSIPHVKTQIRIFGKWANVVGIEIAPAAIATMGARESVSAVNIIAPAFEFGRVAQATARNASAVYVTRRRRPARRSLTSYGADLCSRFNGVFLTETIARARLCRRTHLRSTFIRHFGAA